jgi:hypothetical protein
VRHGLLRQPRQGAPALPEDDAITPSSGGLTYSPTRAKSLVGVDWQAQTRRAVPFVRMENPTKMPGSPILSRE